MAIRLALTLLLTLSLTACARNEVSRPKDQLADATEAMERAAQVNAHEFAAFEMATAERKLLRARDLARSDDDDDRREAARLAEQVSADARFAEAQSRLAQARAINSESRETLDALREQATEETGGVP